MSLKQPVQYPVKYYSHLDEGAPQLADADGVIKTILKACLVTGYGDKAGAGWTALFDDAFRIVLRRPLQTGNPPDIKIENGVINGSASHRIVSQDNPTGLDDSSEVSAVNLLSRDRYCGVEWHLIASDFGFVLCYEVAENQVDFANRRALLYCGSAQNMQDAMVPRFVVSSNSKITSAGIGEPWTGSIFYAKSTAGFTDLREGSFLRTINYLQINGTEKAINDDYLAQKIMLGDDSFLPFLMQSTKQVGVISTAIISVGGRSMLRYVYDKTDVSSNVVNKALYIPLDYWEL